LRFVPGAMTSLTELGRPGRWLRLATVLVLVQACSRGETREFLGPTVPPPTLTRVILTPAAVALAPGATQQFTVAGAWSDGSSTAPAVTYAASGGAITATALYTAGMTPGSFRVIATQQGGMKADTSTVTVLSSTAVVVYPGDNIQTMVDAHAANTQFLIKAGTHRRQSIVPKSGDVFIGELGAILDGENVTPTAFRTFNTYPDGVTIRGLIVEHYVPLPRRAAIMAENGPKWVVAANELRYNGETGILVGAGWQFRNNYVHHNAVSGVQGAGGGALIEANTVSYNNTSGANPSTSTGYAGGMKFFGATDLTIRNNTVIHNTGVGVWCDGGCYRVLYEGNTVSDNTHRGIDHEISYDAVIRDNVCERNGSVTIAGWPSAGGIVIFNSQNVEVVGNTVRDNGDGITGLETPSGSGSRGPYVVANLYVHDNTIAMPSGHTGLAQYQAGDSIFTRNNRFENNTYFLTGGSTPFAFANNWRTEGEWRAFGQDTTGTFNR